MNEHENPKKGGVMQTQNWTVPNPELEHVLIGTPRRSLAFKVQDFLFSKHKIRAALKPQDELWTLEYFPSPDGPTIAEARGIAEAYLTAISAIQIPERKGTDT
jgi:hypothetical protein